MRIGIDLKPFSTGSKFRGIGMYSRELINELLKMNNDAEFHFLNMYTKYQDDPEMDERSYLHEYYTGPQIVDVGERQLFRDDRLDNLMEAQVKHFLKQSTIDIMLFTSPNEYGTLYKHEWFEGVQTAGILYDLIPLMFPDQCLFDNVYRKDYERSLEFIKNLDILFAISQSAKDDAVKLLDIPKEKIVVIYAGIDSSFRKLPKINIASLKAKYNIIDSFLLFAGGIDFKKNIEGLIKAYSCLEKGLIKRYQLVIVGKTADDVIEKYLGLAKEYGVEGRVICTGYVPKQDLIELYNTTDILIFPSLYEGFGLPVIEAMACGARVVTSDCSSLGEIAKGHATLVNPKLVKSITKGIQDVLNNPISSLNLAEESIEYALSYTWEKVAETVYNSLKERTYNKSEITYDLSVTDELLKEIASIYIEHGQLLSYDKAAILAQQLYKITKQEPLPILSGKKRIIYDVTVVREWLKAKYSTGIGRVSKELYKALSTRLNVIPVSVISENEDFECLQVSMDNFEILDKRVELKKDDIFFMPEFQLRGVQISNKHPKAQMLRERGIKCYAILYDILPLQFPEYFEKKTVNKFHDYILEMLHNYDGILSDSRSVSDELFNYYKTKINITLDHDINIGYFHLGQDSFNNNTMEMGNITLKMFMDTSTPVFYMIGTIEPRKGHEIVLSTFEEMWKNNSSYKLCIIGHAGWNMEKFIDRLKGHSEFGKKLIFLEGATDAEVKYAYQNSAALIQASAGEGFGLPLIEAGKYGLPILCSDIPVFHEVAGDNALYFDRNNKESLIQCIEEFLELKEKNNAPDSSDIVGTTWSDVADKVISMLVDDKNWYGSISKDKKVVITEEGV